MAARLAVDRLSVAESWLQPDRRLLEGLCAGAGRVWRDARGGVVRGPGAGCAGAEGKAALAPGIALGPGDGVDRGRGAGIGLLDPSFRRTPAGKPHAGQYSLDR